MKMLGALVLAATFLSGAATAQTSAPAGDAVISYTSLDGLFREFAPAKDGDGVYLRDRSNNWYFARFESRCDALPRSPTLGFKKDQSQRIATGTIVVVPNAGTYDECRIAQFTRSAVPPSGLRNRVIPRTARWSGSVGLPHAAIVSDSGDRTSTRTTLH